jgi:hypothetical protein
MKSIPPHTHGSGAHHALSRTTPAARLVLALAAIPVTAPATLAEEKAEHRTVAIGPQYKAGGLHRALWGGDYRDVWTTPVSLEVLDLQTYAGGLTPTRTIGHGQTEALALKGRDGKDYTFRTVVKDPTGLLPVELQETIARKILLDQMASGHPAAHVIAPGLLQPAGILHNVPRLVIMPDDPVLGEFRAAFANKVGDIEEWGGTPGFAGTKKTIDGEEMWKRLRQSPEVRADSRAYLKARLLDQLMGDWDRHRDQWRWAEVGGKQRWQPVPEDRDQAFVLYEGFFNSLLRPQLPMLVQFGPRYSSLAGLTFDGWDVDKRILADLDKPVWDEVARELQGELTDAVLEAAVVRQPPEYHARNRDRLLAGLKARRDTLPVQADRFYRYINRTVDVFGTDEHERVEAHRFDNGDLELTVRAAGADGEGAGEPYLQRRFVPAVTKEVRVYLYGGNDKVVVTGEHHGGVLLRIIAGDGADVLDDSRGGGTRFSASGPQARVVAGRGTHWDRRPYKEPPTAKRGEWIPARDWGRLTVPRPLLTYAADYGALIGAAVTTTGYGFRKAPWSDQQTVQVVYSTGETGFRGSYLGQFRFENSPLRVGLFAAGSGIDVSRFFGQGNETTFEGDQDTYKVDQKSAHLEPSLIYGVGDNVDVSLGVVAKYYDTDPRDNPVLKDTTFYGQGGFTELGLSARLRVDATDHRALPRRGVFASMGALFYPSVADVTDTFGSIHGQARVFLATSGELAPTLALKAGGERVFGTHPFFDSAFIGGRPAFNPLEPGGESSVRGLPPQRYAGDGSLFGGAELYLPLTRAFLLVPGQVGISGFVDVGRVFNEGESSDRWHPGYGGGVFFASPARRNLVSFTIGRSEGRTGFYIRAGLAF